MKIRRATRKDAEAIAKLMIAEFSKKPFNEKAKLKAVLKSLDFYFGIGKIHVAVEDKDIIGVTVFKIEQHWEGSVILIEDLAVAHEFKKKGVGKELMEYVEKYAKSVKAKSISFRTHKKSPAVKFYQKLGYDLKKDIVHMEKKIRFRHR